MNAHSRRLTFAICLLAFATVQAQSPSTARTNPAEDFELGMEPSQANEQMPAFVRKQYKGSADLPDELALRFELMSLDAARNGSEEHRSRVAHKLSAIMEMPVPEAMDFIDYASGIQMSFEHDYAKLVDTMACPKDRPRAAGDQIFPIYEAIDDAKTGLLTQYLAMIRTDLGEEKFTNFRRYLNYKKSTITHTVFDYKAAYEASGRDIDQSLDAWCAGIESKLGR